MACFFIQEHSSKEERDARQGRTTPRRTHYCAGCCQVQLIAQSCKTISRSYMSQQYLPGERKKKEFSTSSHFPLIKVLPCWAFIPQHFQVARMWVLIEVCGIHISTSKSKLWL